MPGWRSTGVLGVQSSEGVLGQCRLAQQGCYGPGVRVIRVVRVVRRWYGWYTGGTGGTGVQEWRDRAVIGGWHAS